LTASFPGSLPSAFLGKAEERQPGNEVDLLTARGSFRGISAKTNLNIVRSFIPESVRWLLVNGRKEEAREILTNVARIIRRDMPSDELQVQETTAKKDFLDLFKTWKLAKLSIIQLYA